MRLLLYVSPRYRAESNGDDHMNSTDAADISYEYVHIMSNNVEHNFHVKGAVVAQDVFFPPECDTLS